MQFFIKDKWQSSKRCIFNFRYSFLQFNGQEILHDAGKISHKVAQELAYKEYDKFKKKQDQLYISDFDKFIESTKLLGNKNIEKMCHKLSLFSYNVNKTYDD